MRPGPRSDGAVLTGKFWRGLRYRATHLVTRRYTWVADDGQEIHTREDWDTAWAMEGPHTYRWWWVRRWGRLDCGCTRNPLTRRIVLYTMSCEEHMARFSHEPGREEGPP